MSSEDLAFNDLAKVFPAAGKPKLIPTAGTGGTRILLGTDDPIYTLSLFQSLAEAGYEVVVRETGADAITELRSSEHPPVAVLDRALPGMAGTEICTRMREAGKSVYLILQSENPTSQEIVEGLESGADLCLAKAAPIAELLAYIKVGLRSTRA